MATNNKYITMFQDLAAKKPFKEAVNYMGTYFLGLMDNVHYDDFMEIYYKDFVTFTDWLMQITPDELWDSEYGDDEPLLFKLVDSIDEVIETPDSLEVALKKSLLAMTQSSMESLDVIANHFIGRNKQLVMDVNTFNEDGEILHNYRDKFTKREQKNNPDIVRDNIGAGLALVVTEGGYLTIKEREKGRETISVFQGYNGDTLRSVPEDEAEELYEDYVIQNKDIEVEFDSYVPNSALS